MPLPPKLFFIFPVTDSNGNPTLIGISLGEEETRSKWKPLRQVSVKLTMILMCVSGVILFFVARPLMGLLTESSRVVEIGAGMRIVAFSEPFYGLMIVTEGIFMGLGNKVRLCRNLRVGESVFCLPFSA
ncbi:MAG: MATE family efflux transporter [Clostridium sp.]